MAIVNLSQLDDNSYKKRLSVASAVISPESVMRAKGDKKAAAKETYALFQIDPKCIVVSAFVEGIKPDAKDGLAFGFMGKESSVEATAATETELYAEPSLTTKIQAPTAKQLKMFSNTSSKEAAQSGTDTNVIDDTDSGILSSESELSIMTDRLSVVGMYSLAALNGSYRLTVQYLEPTVSTGEFTSYAVTADNFGNPL